ncbi:hypothetical protein CVT91_06605 [Candidatus Atribacteria bacterium HGW-Atribacteria-1]|nr:MAG: hypothetical protein CVT91_06605 [Candidatus Atribacteria bacterium HGW-Atribacteria-1]
MNCKKKVFILAFMLILFSLFFIGCVNIIPNSPSNSGTSIIPIGPTSGWIVIENDAETVKDCTPSLSIYSKVADYMSFSGDGVTWTDWIEYNIYYDKFNIANGLNGTKFGSGTRYVYVRFKDDDGNLSPSDEYAFDDIEYEMGELFSIKIFPKEVAIPVNGSSLFTLHGYDLKSNEVPPDSSKITWILYSCAGNLSPTNGLSATYTTDSFPTALVIHAQYGNLKCLAHIKVVSND